MTKSKAAAPVAPEPTPEEEAQARTKQCWQEVQQVLAKHRCRIQPILNRAVPVGEYGDTVQVSANVTIVPQ